MSDGGPDDAAQTEATCGGSERPTSSKLEELIADARRRGVYDTAFLKQLVFRVIDEVRDGLESGANGGVGSTAPSGPDSDS